MAPATHRVRARSCDVRWPSFTFPYALLEYARERKRPAVLTLTKTDMVAATVAQQWEKHFHTLYPDLRIALTNAFPAADDTPGDRIKSKKVCGALEARVLLKASLTCACVSGADAQGAQTQPRQPRCDPDGGKRGDWMGGPD